MKRSTVYTNRWRNKNKKWVLEYSKRYYAKHREQILSKLKVERPAKARLLSLRYKAWYVKNKAYLKKKKQSQKYKDWSRAYQKLRMWQRKDWQLRQTYGIGMKEYESMFARQRGLCAICGESENGKNRWGTNKFLRVDHCHKKNKVRGLLCAACNAGLGYFKDNPQFLRKAAVYLLTPQTS